MGTIETTFLILLVVITLVAFVGMILDPTSDTVLTPEERTAADEKYERFRRGEISLDPLGDDPIDIDPLGSGPLRIRD